MPTHPQALQRLFKRALTCLCVGLSASLLSACLQVDVRFEVQPDGSGQIVETWRVSGETPPSLQRPLMTALQPSRLDDRARAMGPGVKAHAETLAPAAGEAGEARRVVFEVPDFDGLRWRPHPPPAGPSMDLSFAVSRPPGQAARLRVRHDAQVLAACASPGARGQLLSAAEGLAVDVSVHAIGSASREAVSLLRMQGGSGAAAAFDAACQPSLTLGLR